MDSSFIVVDGSNIATEGRSTPSLAQLDEAVRELQAQFPHRRVIVVVDATFGRRIDPSERPAFDEAVSHGEIVSPPAGAIGRGDAFLLRVAERVGAQVLSNDSFQEFHGEHPWLFEGGRLIGGTPVRGVGWIFTPRAPVRGDRSRAAVAAAKKAVEPAKPAKKAAKPAKEAAKEAAKPAKEAVKPAKKAVKKVEAPAKEIKPPEKEAKTPAKKAKTPEEKPSKMRKLAKEAMKKAGARGLRPVKGGEVEAAIEVATEEALVPGDVRIAEESRGRVRRRRTGPPPAVNGPLTFLTFVSDHPIGSLVEGTVSSFTSHGAMIDVGDMHCYAPLVGLGRPAPRRAREVLERGEKRKFVLVALDPPRRGAELALPAVVPSRRRK